MHSRSLSVWMIFDIYFFPLPSLSLCLSLTLTFSLSLSLYPKDLERWRNEELYIHNLLEVSLSLTPSPSPSPSPSLSPSPSISLSPFLSLSLQQQGDFAKEKDRVVLQKFKRSLLKASLAKTWRDIVRNLTHCRGAWPVARTDNEFKVCGCLCVCVCV